MQKKLEVHSFSFFNLTTARFKNGFLPESPPLRYLPERSALNKKLNTLMKHFNELLKNKCLRKEVAELNLNFQGEILAIDYSNEREINAAMLILCMLTQGFIWEKSDDPENKIPPVIAENVLKIAQQKQRLPIMTYSDYILNNWQLINPLLGFTVENIVPLYTFTNAEDEAWFIKIHVVIESVCAKAVLAARILSSLPENNENNLKNVETIMACLKDVSQSLETSTVYLNRMKEGCNPMFFYTVLKNYLEGWEKVQIANIDNVKVSGVYLSSSDKDQLYSYKGPSGAQGSILPLLDNLLGIKHKVDTLFNTLLVFQQHMPKHHRGLINSVDCEDLRRMIFSSDNNGLKEAWNIAVQKLGTFRLAHLALVEQYIFQPARMSGHNHLTVTGTGGSPREYLGNRYGQTRSMISKL